MDIETPPTEGPRITPIVGLGSPAGLYTEIIAVIAPASASPGDLVNIEARVTNTWDAPFYIAIAGLYDDIEIPFSPEYANVKAGETYSFTSSFTMPNNGVRVHVWSYYWTGEEWYPDDYSYIDIALKVEEIYQGTLTRKELDYDAVRVPFPVE